MKLSINITICFLITILIGCNSSVKKQLIYIDQNQPTIIPRMFAKNFISNDTIAEYGSVFNQKGDEFYFGVDLKTRSEIRYTKIEKGKWINPITIISDDKHSFNDPFLSPDENRLYYISDQPRSKQDTIKDFDIWYSIRENEKWSAPINAGMVINSDANEFYISFNNEGTMYFASNKGKVEKRKHDFDIYKSGFLHNEFEIPKKLGDAINSKRYEADVFISPDESYIIYVSARKSGLGKGDLYISFKDEDGNWTNSVNMGTPINSEGHEICPFVTKDGKFFFYTSNQDIYWVSTEIFKELKQK